MTQNDVALAILVLIAVGICLAVMWQWVTRKTRKDVESVNEAIAGMEARQEARMRERCKDGDCDVESRKDDTPGAKITFDLKGFPVSIYPGYLRAVEEFASGGTLEARNMSEKIVIGGQVMREASPPIYKTYRLPKGSVTISEMGYSINGGKLTARCVPNISSLCIGATVTIGYEDGHYSDAVALAEAIRQSVAKNNPYRGSIMSLDMSWFDRVTDYGFPYEPSDYAPQFLDVPDGIDFGSISVSASMAITHRLLPYFRREEMQRIGIIPRRGVLFEGPFGTGKTTAALCVAKECVRNGWGFVYMKRPAELEHVLDALENSGPMCVFVEDIEEKFSGARNPHMNRALNAIDGACSKNRELIMIYSTNNPGSLNKAFLRPGRVDDVITFGQVGKGSSIARSLCDMVDFDDAEDDHEFSCRVADLTTAEIHEVMRRIRIAMHFQLDSMDGVSTPEGMCPAISAFRALESVESQSRLCRERTDKDPTAEELMNALGVGIASTIVTSTGKSRNLAEYDLGLGGLHVLGRKAVTAMANEIPSEEGAANG